MSSDLPDVAQHYFSADPAGPDERRTITVRLAGRDVSVHTSTGVFSGDRLDLGTSVLLREVPLPPAQGTFLDLGCGWGPITLSLGSLAPAATVWAVDVNARARMLTADNARSMGLERVQVAAPDDVPDSVTFDLIWSNPPIRIGKNALHVMLHYWLARLAPGGIAYLVVQRHLGSDSLQAWLAGTLGSAYEVGRLASAKGFRVLSVRRLDPDQLTSA
ncbi:Ribosomal RNA small subunit methyltransferase C [Austwickia sp. TVS 96-490-7B]|uniref:class I SAM-dependent methyltransferase n=1 Tax=Austwickia sp. TVS 96-490-7B TaxID=2830843 RepID=UPI001C572D19|nr:methyltransferase [Austwickia sp. TVS 96-490-7B]MBW3086940.1 Ribosomal RNA small subunit methyltransferase C [Austwickia sp. TVS 96-490-7B]